MIQIHETSGSERQLLKLIGVKQLYFRTGGFFGKEWSKSL
jgi:hypothetical protein